MVWRGGRAGRGAGLRRLQPVLPIRQRFLVQQGYDRLDLAAPGCKGISGYAAGR